jgi:hypothetical protein
MIKSAVAYRTNGTVVIGSAVRTTMGVALEVEPAVLGASPTEESTARALSHALAQSDRVVPHPAQQQWKGLFQPFLEATGVQNLKAFMAGAQQVSIDASAGQLRLTPMRNLGSKEGFEELLDQAVLLPSDDWSSAAATLLRMLEARPA